MGGWNKGLKSSEETKRRMSEARRNRPPDSEETKMRKSKAAKKRGIPKKVQEKAWEATKGKPISDEHKKKLSIALKGKNTWSKGVSPSLETRLKLSDKNRGEKSGTWQGGKTPMNKIIRASMKYQEWRQQVFIRDNFTCQKCGIKSGKGIKGFRIEAHHKNPFHNLLDEVQEYLPLFSVYNGAMLYSPLWDLDNGITLCNKCHKKIHKKR